MAAVHKKHEVKPEEKSEEKPASDTTNASEEIVVSDVVTETTERIEVIEEVTPAESAPAADPLTDFKEKMTEEEYPGSDAPAKKNFMWPILFIFVIAILLLGGVFFYKNSSTNKTEKVNVVTLSPSPTAVPEPTATAADLSKYEIKVLNGSEVNGEAGRQKANLEKEGFTVSSTGNADKSDYTDTLIQAKKEVDKVFLGRLKKALEGSFTIGENEVLPDTATTPVVVIIGVKK